MMSANRTVLFIGIGLLLGILIMFGFSNSQSRDKDAEVLMALEKNGSNLTRVHNIDFFLYFPSENDAQEAAKQIKDLYPDFETNVHQLENSPDWTLQLAANIVPELSMMQKIRTDFERISAGLSGKYDGWGAGITN